MCLRLFKCGKSDQKGDSRGPKQVTSPYLNKMAHQRAQWWLKSRGVGAQFQRWESWIIEINCTLYGSLSTTTISRWRLAAAKFVGWLLVWPQKGVTTVLFFCSSWRSDALWFACWGRIVFGGIDGPEHVCWFVTGFFLCEVCGLELALLAISGPNFKFD